MTEIIAIVECRVIFNDGTIKISRPTFTEFSVSLASVDKVSVVNYVRSNLTNVKSIEIIDTLYFRNKMEFEKYLNSL
jgi:hypothetical protein